MESFVYQFPKIECNLIIPETPVFLKPETPVKHINGTEAAMIRYQTLFMFYLQAARNNDIDIAYLKEQNPNPDRIFVGKESVKFNEFFGRNEPNLKSTYTHKNVTNNPSGFMSIGDFKITSQSNNRDLEERIFTTTGLITGFLHDSINYKNN